MSPDISRCGFIALTADTSAFIVESILSGLPASDMLVDLLKQL